MREQGKGKETTLADVVLKLLSTVDLVETEMSLVRWFGLSFQIEL